jgi:hypothetical protein
LLSLLLSLLAAILLSPPPFTDVDSSVMTLQNDGVGAADLNASDEEREEEY